MSTARRGSAENEIFRPRIQTAGAEAFEGSVRFPRAVRDTGLRRAVVSSSVEQIGDAVGSFGLVSRDQRRVFVRGGLAGITGRPAAAERR